MPFGVGYDNFGQAPGAQQGFLQQQAQAGARAQGQGNSLQDLIARLGTDPAARQRAAEQLAQQMPPPPAFTQPIGSGESGGFNAVGLPQGVRPQGPLAPNPPLFTPDPFVFGGPGGVGAAQAAQAGAAQGLGVQPPGGPAGIAPNYLQQLLALAGNPGVR